MFDLYFAGSQNELAEKYIMDNGCNRLLSYYNDKSLINKWVNFKKNNPNCTNKFFIDCGAFTAFTQGITINIDDYINYINEIIDYVDIVASLDVIGGPQDTDTDRQTYENYLYIKQRIKYPGKLLPTFHFGDDIKYLNLYLQDMDINYIAFGALVAKNKESVINFCSYCYNTINKVRPDIHIHAFGMTSKTVLQKFPFSSADSTGWIMTAANGSIMTPWGTVNVSEKSKVDKHNYFNLDTTAQSYIQDYVKQLGFTMEQCCSDYKVRTLINIMYLKQFQDNHKPRLAYHSNFLF